MSAVDDIAAALETRFADATVSFSVGANTSNQHGQRRRIIFTRVRGVLRHSSSPQRVVDAPGAPGTHRTLRFQREEMLLVELRAESDTALDVMFDRFVECVFDEYGANALLDDNGYEWAGGDSTHGGSNTSRVPSIQFPLWVRLLNQANFPMPLVDADHEGTVTMLGQSQAVNPLPP